MSLGEISTWIGGLSKTDCPLPCEWASSNPLMAWIKQQVEERQICPFVPASPLDLGHIILSSLVPRLIFTQLAPVVIMPLHIQIELHHWLSWASSLQTADPGSSQPPSSHKAISQNLSFSLSLSVYIYIYICLYVYVLITYWFCFSEEPWLTKMVSLKGCPKDKPFYTSLVCPRPHCQASWHWSFFSTWSLRLDYLIPFSSLLG